MKTIIILLFSRELLEKVESKVFENISEFVDELRSLGMTEEQEDSLGCYEISEFMDLVNDQILDNLQDTFLGYIKLKD